MNPLRKLRSAFNRAKVNHPVKTYTGGTALAGGALVTAAAMSPLDGGLSFIFLCTSSLFVTCGVVVKTAHTNGYFPHGETTSLHHNGAGFEVTKAQSRAYNKLGEKVRKLEKAYDAAGSDRERASLTKKAQSLVNFQEDILDSGNVRRSDDTTPRPAMRLRYRDR